MNAFINRGISNRNQEEDDKHKNYTSAKHNRLNIQIVLLYPPRVDVFYDIVDTSTVYRQKEQQNDFRRKYSPDIAIAKLALNKVKMNRLKKMFTANEVKL